MKRLNILLILLVSAIAVFGQKDINELKQKAENGDSSSQYTLATYYRFGAFGVPKNYELATFWYQKASNRENGSRDNNAYRLYKYMLGLCYYEGTDKVQQDYSKAVSLFKQSTDQAAYAKLGDCYYYGRGVDKDFKQAVSYYQLGAEGTFGDSDAMRGLARCYYNGNGVEQNYMAAIHLWERCNDAESDYNLGKCYELGLGVAKDQSAATTWYAKSAARGNVIAMYLLGCRYAHGETVEKDARQAAHYFEQLLTMPDNKSERLPAYKLFAKFELAAIYGYENAGVTKNLQRASELLQDIALKDEANLLLGNIYYEDGTRGTQDSYEKAIEYLNKAKAGQNKDATAAANFILSKCYRFGRGVPTDINQADKLLEESQKGGWESTRSISQLIPVMRIEITQ